MTVHEYKLASQCLEEICHCNKCLRWYNWWKVCRYHLVPAFRGFGWTGTNWAEIGHSTLRHNKHVWLVTAALEDVASAIIEHNQYISFVNKGGKTVGKGPTLLSKKLDECNQMRAFTNSAVDAILTGDVTQEINIDLEEDAMFIPRKSAKHLVQKKFSTKNQTQKDCTAGKKKGAASTSKMPPKKPKKTTSPQYDMLEDDHLSDHMQTLFNEENESFTPDASHTADESADEGDEGDDEEDECT